AVTTQTFHFCSTLQTWPLGTGVYAVRPHRQRSGTANELLSQAFAVGLSEIDMAHCSKAAWMAVISFTIEEGMFTPPGVVDDLPRNSDATWPGFRVNATHRIDADKLFHAKTMQGPHIGAVIDAMRWNLVVTSMARQKRD